MKTVKLNKEIYEKDMVKSAIKAYRGLCDVNLCSSKDYYICIFKNCRYDENLTTAEFENYVIDLMNCSAT